VTAGNVISQNPAAGTELAPGSAVSIVVGLGPVPAEGEPAEGEGESVDTGPAQQRLAAAYDAADTNQDGILSFEESAAAVPGLTQTVFDTLDTSGDGQLSQDELGMQNGSGCAGCTGAKGAFSPGGRTGDLFLTAVGALGLAVFSTFSRP
jgi:beta-lactam-binding protein with PASTA domain